MRRIEIPRNEINPSFAERQPLKKGKQITFSAAQSVQKTKVGQEEEMARTNIRSQSNDPERSDSVQKIYELTNQRCQEIKKLIMEKAQLSSQLQEAKYLAKNPTAREDQLKQTVQQQQADIVQLKTQLKTLEQDYLQQIQAMKETHRQEINSTKAEYQNKIDVLGRVISQQQKSPNKSDRGQVNSIYSNVQTLYEYSKTLNDPISTLVVNAPANATALNTSISPAYSFVSKEQESINGLSKQAHSSSSSRGESTQVQQGNLYAQQYHSITPLTKAKSNTETMQRNLIDGTQVGVPVYIGAKNLSDDSRRQVNLLSSQSQSQRAQSQYHQYQRGELQSQRAQSQSQHGQLQYQRGGLEQKNVGSPRTIEVISVRRAQSPPSQLGNNHSSNPVQNSKGWNISSTLAQPAGLNNNNNNEPNNGMAFTANFKNNINTQKGNEPIRYTNFSDNPFNSLPIAKLTPYIPEADTQDSPEMQQLLKKYCIND